jgi:hypothetical protein
MKSPPAPLLPAPSPSTLQIKVANLTDTVLDDELNKVLAAINVQISDHFAPEWRATGTLELIHVKLDGAVVSVNVASDAIIYVGDSVDDPKTGAKHVKGYHDQNSAGLPYGFVYLDECKKSGDRWQVTLSHEVLEMLADPTACLRVEDTRSGQTNGYNYALEVCDPTQADSYLINGIPVANFVSCAFFGMQGKLTKMNYLGCDQVPFTPRVKGYVQYYDGAGAAHQIWGDDVTEDLKAARLAYGPHRRNARRRQRIMSAQTATSH